MTFFHRHSPLPLLFFAACLGCGQGSAPDFHLNMVKMASKELDDDYQQQIADVLGAMFGTPDKPATLPETGFDQRRLELAAGAAWNAADGVGHGLYRRHCVHCHGITGDGRGPTARFLNPYPRDYRKGIFKFKSTYNSQKPTDDDLHRVLMNGVPGTSMPSFSLLPPAEVESLLEYVKYLSIRGEMEQKLADYAYDLGEEETVDDKGAPVLNDKGEPVMRLIPLDPTQKKEQADEIKGLLEEVMEPWNAAKEQVIAPDEAQIPHDGRPADEVAASIAKGRELFYDKRANCYTCHGPTGLGDGQQNDWDVWNKEANELVTTTKALAEQPDKDATDLASLSARQKVVASLYPIRNAIPRNLRKGIYRGGNRRIDVYHRIHAGIAGTPMPGSGPASAGAQGTLKDEEIWNIVDYVLSLPYEAISKPQTAVQMNPRPVTQ